MTIVVTRGPSKKKEKKPMPRIIHYIGFLANADSSIMKVRLKHGFRVEAMSHPEAVDLICALANISYNEAMRLLFVDFRLLRSHEEQVYVIRNSLDTKGNHEKGNPWNAASKFDREFVYEYLHSRLRLIRLFKEGNLVMPLEYYYAIQDGKPTNFMNKRSGKPIIGGLYHLESSEVRSLHRFLRETSIPFREAFLQLAFENLELSYETVNYGLSFLTLMISLETLLNPGEHELRYRISRNAAVLLGNNRKESKAIFSEIKKLYDKRSKAIHTGETKAIDREDVLRLRNYVRESIKKMYQMKRSKNDILDLLNSHGFGERAAS